MDEAETPMVLCPNCKGAGEVNAMSGCDLPHKATCVDCKGNRVVTQQEAVKIKDRLDKWLRESHM